MHEKILELINKSIDGTASDLEEQELQENIERDPDVRHLNDEFVKVSNALGSMKSIEPPVNLRQRILNAVPVSMIPRSRPQAIVLERLGIPQIFQRHQVAYIFAGGIAVVVMLVIAFVLGLATRSDNDVSQMYGTIAERTLLDRATLINQANFSVEGLTGSVRLNRDRDLFLVDLTMDAQTSPELKLTFDPNALRLTGFRQLDGTVLSMNSTGNTVTVTLQGQNRSVVVFTKKSSGDASVSLTVLQGNRTVYEHTLEAGKN